LQGLFNPAVDLIHFFNCDYLRSFALFNCGWKPFGINLSGGFLLVWKFVTINYFFNFNCLIVVLKIKFSIALLYCNISQ
jgi:hypothetical protein